MGRLSIGQGMSRPDQNAAERCIAFAIDTRPYDLRMLLTGRRFEGDRVVVG